MANNVVRNGWSEDAKYVLISLEELKKQHTESDDKNDSFREEVIREISDLRGELKVIDTKITQKATAIGALAGLVPATLALIWMLLKTRGLG